MTTANRAQQQMVNQRIAQLIKQGLTTEQIHRRTGAHKRRVLRIKAKLKQSV